MSSNPKVKGLAQRLADWLDEQSASSKDVVDALIATLALAVVVHGRDAGRVVFEEWTDEVIDTLRRNIDGLREHDDD
jgi:hypothetical protein